MALTVDRALPDILLCGLPEYLGLTTDRTILTAGTPAVMLLTFPAATSDGDIMRLKWIGNDHTFTFRNVPDDSGFELPVFNTIPEYAAFIAALAANFYIDADFVVASVTDTPPYTFTLTAKENGANYTMDTGVEAKMAITTPGVDDEFSKNLSVFMQVYAKIDGVIELVNTIDSSVANDASLKLFPGEILQSLIVPELPVTEITGVGVDKYHRFFPSNSIRYYLKYYERYGDPAVAAIAYNFGDAGNLKIAFDFSLNKIEIPGNTAVANYFTDTADRQFLKKIKTKRARAGYVDFLDVYIKSGSTGTISCYVNYYFADATSALGLLTLGTKTISTSTDDQVYEFAMPFDVLLAYATGLSKTIDYVEVYVESTVGGGTAVQTEKITYELDSSLSDQFHVFLYKNPRGGWCTTYFTGFIKNLKEYERVEAQLISKVDFDKNASDIYTYNSLVQDIFELATGLLYADELANLEEFAASELVYYLDGAFGDSNAFWRAVTIEPDAFTTLDSSEGETESRLFRFKNAFIN